MCIRDSNYTGNNMTAVGLSALRSCTTGTQNTALGDNTLYSCTTGIENVAVGTNALYSMTTNSHNVAIGRYCLMQATGGNNTSIGYNAGYSLTSGTNNVTIGSGSESSGATVDNEFTLGNSNTATLRCNDTSISSLSDGRDKTDVVDLPAGLDFINTLQPRKFKWQTRDGNIKDGRIRAGFIAQELQSAQEDYKYLDLVMENNPERLEAKQEHLVPVLVQAVKELSTKNDELAAEIASLKSQINN